LIDFPFDGLGELFPHFTNRPFSSRLGTTVLPLQ
jgi:hypothetical protein